MSRNTVELPDFDGVINWQRFDEWLQTQSLPGSGPITAVRKLTGGSQNNLLLMTRDSERFVLRRPPKHLRANSNETMLREARVLGALEGSKVPHPALLAACDDTSVIGACFYIMSPLDGFSAFGALPGSYATDQSWRAAMGPEFVRAAAALAEVDYKAAGLENFGKPAAWHERQVARWRAQLESYRELQGYEGSSLPYVEEVGRWLNDHLPKNGRIGIIHGDYQFPNVMFSPHAPRIVGLIDWELSTLGDPLLDLGWVLQSWTEPGDPEGHDPIVTPWDGFSPRAELVELYGRMTGRNMSEMPWYFVLACYKLGCILEGTYARAMAGKASMETGLSLHNYAHWLFRKAKQLISG